MTKKIDDFLNMRSLEDIDTEIEEETELIVPDEEDIQLPAINQSEEALEDIEYVRDNVRKLIEKGNDALDDLVDLAKQSEQARAYEVASTMMKTLLDANKQFMDTAKEKKEMKKTDPMPGDTNITNNTLVMTTDQVLNMIKKQNDK